MSGYIAVNDLRRACLVAATSKRLEKEISQQFSGDGFHLEYNRLGFFTGVDKDTWNCEFLLSLTAAEELVDELEGKLECSLGTARQAIQAAPQHNWAKYDNIQSVEIPTPAMYLAITKSFAKLARQSKTQALYSECRLMLVDATNMAQPVSTELLRQQEAGGCATMFISLDFEFWEKSHDYILEVGYSLWDNLTQRHRTRHWVIKENLNKCNGKHVNDNRMRFMFGSSDKGTLDAAMDALQQEVDELGLTEGLSRQEKLTLRKAGVKLVLVGHGMNQDLERAEGEIEWPDGMPIMDTQKLYLAYQLKQLDAAAAAKALEAVVAQKDKDTDAAEPLFENGNDLGLDSDTEEDELELLGRVAAGAGDDDDADESGLSDVTAGLAGCSVQGSSQCNDRTKADKGDVDVSGLVLVKTKQLQLPKKVRPWPAGPAPEDLNKPASTTDDSTSVKEERLDRQIGLSGLLAALNIKASKLHNAGNDARFTMEAFLALCGHPACPDPVQAHIDSLTSDVSYQQALEESLKAAAAQGWGTPVSSDSQGRINTPVSQDGSIEPGFRGYAAAASRPGSGAAPAWSTGYNGSQGLNGLNSAVASSDNGSVVSLGGLSPRPGFAARPQAPPGFEMLRLGTNTGQGYPTGTTAPAAVDDEGYPPGFSPNRNNPASAVSSWAAKVGGAGGGNAWGRGLPTSTTRPASAAASQHGQNHASSNAWGKAPIPATTSAAAPAAGPSSWGCVAAKGSSSAWGDEAGRPAATAATGGGRGWGQPPSRQNGFAAHNSSVDTGYVPVEYEHNPDAF